MALCPSQQQTACATRAPGEKLEDGTRNVTNGNPLTGGVTGPVATGKKQQSSKQTVREGRNPLPAIPRVPGYLPS